VNPLIETVEIEAIHASVRPFSGKSNLEIVANQLRNFDVPAALI